MHRSTQDLAAHERQQQARHQRHLSSSADLPVEPLTLALVHGLAALPPAVTVSLYLPTHRPTTERQQDHIRIKNLLHQARIRIIQVDGEVRADEIIAPIDRLAANPSFWMHPSDGVVLFCRKGSIRLLRTSTPMPELALVSEHCHIKPLMPLLQDESRFHLLAISSLGVQLYQGTRISLNSIDLPGAPTAIDHGLPHPLPEHLAGALATNGHGTAAMHDSGPAVVSQARERTLAYFRRVDACVCALLQGEHAPLVLAGVADLLPLYAGVNHYAHLESTRIPSAAESPVSDSLYDQAWSIIGPLVTKPHETAFARYAQVAGSDHASTDLPTIVRAGIQGRIDHLFIASDRERWGTYDRLNDKVREHQPRWPEDDDLLNVAIIAALAHRSAVHVAPQALMPNNAEISAIFRY